MRKAPMRLSCPACLGVVLEDTAVGKGIRVRHCRRCGGTWLPHGQIPRLRTVPASAVRAMIRRADDAGYLCHGCGTPMSRDAAKCPACGWVNTLPCPECGRRMRRETHNGVTVDVCRPCTAVWLDHQEISTLWASAATVAVAQASTGSMLADAGAEAGSFLLEALFYAPDLPLGLAHAAVRGVGSVAGEGVELAANVAGSAPGLLSSTPKAVAGFVEIAGDVAGSVFGFILEIIGGIFDGIG